MRASERALRGPQLDSVAGDREENEEQRARAGREGGRHRARRRTTGRCGGLRPLMLSEEEEERERRLNELGL